MDYVRIDIRKIDGSTLNSRDEAIKLFNFLQGSFTQSTIILDFTDVDFMSRSFADEFYRLKTNWKLHVKKDIKLENENKQIVDILNAVSRTQYNQNNRRELNSELRELQFADMTQFEEYLLAV
ncbi:MAG TPA: hypothetical protein VM802_24970 [Chitinophaga sp.]|uniref:hypothetical protein n=1 Tax=Chitinophaga sp. TaxID=1869181 RepID=UPI002C860C71|nr:hypothetical protein [Chitinophaga sp.]HVI48144.1 hypothetical protein [Chitinophaga sp.]